jgi:hypothetical protein
MVKGGSRVTQELEHNPLQGLEHNPLHVMTWAGTTTDFLTGH